MLQPFQSMKVFPPATPQHGLEATDHTVPTKDMQHVLLWR